MAKVRSSCDCFDPDKTLCSGFWHQLLSPLRYRGGRPILNVFNIDTNEEWKLRRTKFRHPFSYSTLRGFTDEMKELIDTLCGKIDSKILTNEAIPVDVLFGQLAMDTICRVAFSYDLKALHDSEDFKFAYDNLQGILEVRTSSH